MRYFHTTVIVLAILFFIGYKITNAATFTPSSPADFTDGGLVITPTCTGTHRIIVYSGDTYVTMNSGNCNNTVTLPAVGSYTLSEVNSDNLPSNVPSRTHTYMVTNSFILNDYSFEVVDPTPPLVTASGDITDHAKENLLAAITTIPFIAFVGSLIGVMFFPKLFKKIGKGPFGV